MRNVREIETASHWREHLEIAIAILSTPSDTKGAVIECGCYRGGATVNLSLVCNLAKRKLIVFDSFEGLPEPEDWDRIHHLPDGRKSIYKKGKFSCSLGEVKRNILKYGCIDVCDFVSGWFEDTLQDLDKKIIVALLDVDLRESLETCVQALWDKAQPGCKFFCHEAPHLENVRLFFDDSFWKEKMKQNISPGFIGGGTGLPLLMTGRIIGSALGYSVKASEDG